MDDLDVEILERGQERNVDGGDRRSKDLHLLPGHRHLQGEIFFAGLEKPNGISGEADAVAYKPRPQGVETIEPDEGGGAVDEQAVLPVLGHSVCRQFTEQESGPWLAVEKDGRSSPFFFRT